MSLLHDESGSVEVIYGILGCLNEEQVRNDFGGCNVRPFTILLVYVGF
jgi:hypothetical protein